MISISVIFPVRNEERRIAKGLNTFISLFREEFPEKFELIPVSNGSTDNTNKILKENFSKKNYVRCLFLSTPGKGKAIVEGLKIAKGNIIGFIDIDDSFDHQAIKNIIKGMEMGKIDCMIGSKWLNQDFFSVGEPIIRKFLSRVWNRLIKFLFGLPFDDTQAGLKFMKKEVLEEIGYDFYCGGFEFDTEFLYRIYRNGHKIKEVFVESKSSAWSTFNIIDCFQMFEAILKFKLKGI